MKPLWCVRLGEIAYDQARELQKRLERARREDRVPDLLLLLEHPPVYTKGRRAEPGELAMGEDWYRMQGIEVADSDRGGKVTYHGPGQLVGYPIVSLKDLKPAAPGREAEDVRGIGAAAYVSRMERVMIASLAELGISAEVIEGLTGVWVGGPPPAGRKIGSIGVHISGGITTHGFAINVNNDLQPFEWIVPCGIEGVRMTSVCRELGGEHDLSAFMDVVRDRFGEVYGRDPVEVSEERLMRESGEPLSVR
jgi:lipoyl(octanoyl) transferase